jgi:hypothetical protein
MAVPLIRANRKIKLTLGVGSLIVGTAFTTYFLATYLAYARCDRNYERYVLDRLAASETTVAAEGERVARLVEMVRFRPCGGS